MLQQSDILRARRFFPVMMMFTREVRAVQFVVDVIVLSHTVH
jgi:hypothetical protein